jgi:predicted MFS family arabinose efflux permease
MNVVVWNSAMAAGEVLDDVMLGQWGVGSFPWVLLVLLLAGFAIALRARAHGFTQGDRYAGSAVVGH